MNTRVRPRLFAADAALVAAITATLIFAAPAQAAQPPAGYPTSEIMAAS